MTNLIFIRTDQIWEGNIFTERIAFKRCDDCSSEYHEDDFSFSKDFLQIFGRKYRVWLWTFDSNWTMIENTKNWHLDYPRRTAWELASKYTVYLYLEFFSSYIKNDTLRSRMNYLWNAFSHIYLIWIDRECRWLRLQQLLLREMNQRLRRNHSFILDDQSITVIRSFLQKKPVYFIFRYQA